MEELEFGTLDTLHPDVEMLDNSTYQANTGVPTGTEFLRPIGKRLSTELGNVACLNTDDSGDTDDDGPFPDEMPPRK